MSFCDSLSIIIQFIINNISLNRDKRNIERRKQTVKRKSLISRYAMNIYTTAIVFLLGLKEKQSYHPKRYNTVIIYYILLFLYENSQYNNNSKHRCCRRRGRMGYDIQSKQAVRMEISQSSSRLSGRRATRASPTNRVTYISRIKEDV